MDRKCKNCLKWDTQVYPMGFCKAHAPMPTIVKGEEVDKYVLVWPSTGADDWCYDFEAISAQA